ncbi:Xaa-Pro aminopeptidase [Kordiimonas sediminis]|uniref:Xaa-Pro aminopeptidase n=1 Tax=Kordiimonas sediminis TaxID=1735581 RepID=A0A919E7S7_9PROT|nr:M24 family metallopeptidase [Kordiimonas sediminis]GHF22913.1 Xaa-Pro aminopeptidase [Kordiimonas sediminis]
MKALFLSTALGLSLSFGVVALDNTDHAKEQINPAIPDILSMKERAEVRDSWLRSRLDTVVPEMMRREGIDMWIMVAREYNEDPVVKTMLPATWLNARRRTVLVFHDTGEKVERFAVARYAVSDIFPAAWNPEEQPDQWQRLADLITERNPQKIGLNISDTYALASGLSYSQHKGLLSALPDEYSKRIVSAEKLAVGWLETRIPAEMETYPEIVRIAHGIIAEGFSNKVITPGETTTEDVVWWFRDRIRSLGLTTWFHPSVNLQRPDEETKKMTELFSKRQGPNVIMPGDLLHVDFGITYLGLNTDTQHHAYVLKPGETEAPAGLKQGLKNANRLQDILTSHFKVGRSGNETVALTRAQAIKEGLNPTVYSHPIGYHGHAAGAAIGMWDNQGRVIGTGDFPVNGNTAWSIELNNVTKIPEWGGQEVKFMLEEDAYFDGTSVQYIDGRQDQFHLIASDK